MVEIPAAEYPEEELKKFNIQQPSTTSHVVKVVKSKHSHHSHRGIHRQKVQVLNSTLPSQQLRHHISERSWTIRNWYRHIHWRNMYVTVLIPFVGIVPALYSRVYPKTQTMYFALFEYIITSLSVNIFYNRYLCHHSFQIDSTHFIQLLAMVSSGAGITSARNWCSAHRAHHRHCDVTDRDPHNIRKGFFFSHIGWTILVFNPKVSEAIHADKLDKFAEEQIVQWQAQNYISLYTSFGLIIPCIFCGWFYEDYMGGLLYAGFLRVFLNQQSYFLINSLGHIVGSKPYNGSVSARNNVLVNFLTLGEGNQNFHHEFPNDYRNGGNWYDWDPTRWSILLMKALGIGSNLHAAPDSIIEKSLVQEEQRQLDNERSELKWGIPIDRLPIFTVRQFNNLVSKYPNRFYVVVSGIIHDVTPFAASHPGGLELMEATKGKDATTAFNGAVYQHSNAARNLLATMRIGVLSGSEAIFWKQEQVENNLMSLNSDSGGHKMVRSGSQATSSNGIIGDMAGAA